MNAFARRLALWRLLASSTEPIGLRALAERFEVSKHTIQRDLDALSTAGVPVVEEHRGQTAFFSIRSKGAREP
jgi:predicted DNA-binding transcriptional regulator YafY